MMRAAANMNYLELLRFLEKEFPIARFKAISKPIKINKTYFLKINSMEHKTDVHGVYKVSNSQELAHAFKELEKIEKPPYILQESVDGKEFIVGLIKDKTFGDVIMFGAGGILTEVYKDVSFRKCPISKNEAIKMIKETKVNKLFEGFRGMKLDINKTAELLSKISRLPQKLKFKSMDFNPIMINENEAKIVDARLIL